MLSALRIAGMRTNRVRHWPFGSSQQSVRHPDRHSGDSHQVAGGHGELELLIDPPQSAKHRLSNPTDGLAPAEMLLDAFADDLAHAITRDGGWCARRSHCRRDASRCSRRGGDLALAAAGDEISGVVGLVGADATATGCSGMASSIASAALRSPKPSAWVTTALTTKPLRFSISTCPW